MAGTANSLSFDNLGGFAQFVGASPATTGITNSRPSTPSSSDGFEGAAGSSDMDPELVVILKKVSKRDAVTKLKALEELENYLKSNTHAVSLILHNWVCFFVVVIVEKKRERKLLTFFI